MSLIVTWFPYFDCCHHSLCLNLYLDLYHKTSLGAVSTRSTSNNTGFQEKYTLMMWLAEALWRLQRHSSKMSSKVLMKLASSYINGTPMLQSWRERKIIHKWRVTRLMPNNSLARNILSQNPCTLLEQTRSLPERLPPLQNCFLP